MFLELRSESFLLGLKATGSSSWLEITDLTLSSRMDCLLATREFVV